MRIFRDGMWYTCTNGYCTPDFPWTEFISVIFIAALIGVMVGLLQSLMKDAKKEAPPCSCGRPKERCSVCNDVHCPLFCPKCKGPCTAAQPTVKTNDDWKQKAEAQVQARRNREQSEYSRQEEQKQQKARKRQAAEQKREENKFRNWQSRFRCHVCGICATQPGYRLGKYYKSWSGGQPPSPGGYKHIDDWSKPGDLFRCKNFFCQEWTHRNCMVDGKCKRCWGY